MSLMRTYFSNKKTFTVISQNYSISGEDIFPNETVCEMLHLTAYPPEAKPRSCQKKQLLGLNPGS